MSKKKLTRNTKSALLGGVCAGIADYFDTDPTIVRVLWVLGTALFMLGPGILAYIVLWIVIPEK